MQKVDPFIPVKTPSLVTSQKTKVKLADNTHRATDGFLPTKKPERLTYPREFSKTIPSKPTQATHKMPAITRPAIMESPKPKGKKEKSRIKKILWRCLHVLVFVSLFGMGLLVRSILIGQVLIILYAIASYFFKIESRTTFILALISIGVVLIASLRSDTVLAGTFAVYAFLLLVIGVISLGREVHNEI